MVDIIIADDHAVVRTGLQLMFENTEDLRIVAECRTADELLDLLKYRSFDLAIVDVHMPGKDTLELLGKVKKGYKKMPVVIFTMSDDQYHMTKLFQAGAAGFISKQSSPDEIVFVIRQVVKNKRYISNNQALVLAGLMIDGAEDDSNPSVLTPREFQVFNQIAVGHDYNTIALKLNVSKNTISNHRNSILKKLRLNNNSDITRFAIKNGLIK